MMSNNAKTTSDRLWALYCRFLVRFAPYVIFSAILISVGLTTCFFQTVHVSVVDQNDFFLPSGRSIKNAKKLINLFGNDKNFRVHQQLNLYPALDVIVRRKIEGNDNSQNSSNMLNQSVIEEVRKRTRLIFNQLITSIKSLIRELKSFIFH